MLSVALNGGLGNQLFQLAAADTLSRETGRTLCMLDYESPETVHSKTRYFLSVFSEFAKCPLLPHPRSSFQENSFKRIYNVPDVSNVCLHGYFQNWEYISPSFKDQLQLPVTQTTDTAFLHIRGGDYVNHFLHDIKLETYYQRAIQYFPKDTHFCIFTNDIEYAQTMPFLKDINHSFIKADEVTSLSLMKGCSRGGICANSSFSWWGAFLNPNRTIVMPDKWFMDSTIYINGYYFPGVIQCPV